MAAQHRAEDEALKEKAPPVRARGHWQRSPISRSDLRLTAPAACASLPARGLGASGPALGAAPGVTLL